MGVDRRRGAIVLEVFERAGLGVSEIRNFDLVGVVENHHWSGDGIDISFRYLNHRLQFSDVPHEVRSVVRDRG